MNLSAPLFRVLQASPQVRAVLGNPVRVYSFGQAEDSPGLVKPYLVWQNVGGTPSNSLADRPTNDTWNVQVDIYADTEEVAEEVAGLVIHEVETQAYVTSFNGQDRDPGTRDFRFSFDLEWNTLR